MAKLQGATDSEKLKDLSSKNYKDQAIWFLNSFWEEFTSKEAENIWNYREKIAKLDLQKGADGNEVDEFLLHKFLEENKETQTVREMRDNLRETGAVTDLKLKYFSLVHFLVYRYKVDYKVLVNAHQGSNQKEVDEAQRMLAAVQVAFKEAEEKAAFAKAALKEAEAKEAEAKKKEQEAKEAEALAKEREQLAIKNENDAKAKESEAKTREQEAKAREAEAKQAQEELEAALADLKAQEEDYRKKTEDLKKRSEEGGVVQQNKAKAELAQHLAKDPLPLSRAKITQEAAVKKADKATKAAEEARAASQVATQKAADARSAAEASAREASQARAEAEQHAANASAARGNAERARQASADAKDAADAAADDAAKKVDEAEAYLNEVKSRPGSAHGAMWYMQRELHEAKKYMPTRKGGIAK